MIEMQLNQDREKMGTNLYMGRNFQYPLNVFVKNARAVDERWKGERGRKLKGYLAQRTKADCVCVFIL